MRILATCAAFAVLCALGRNREARVEPLAAPSVIVFTGKPLKSPVVLTDWSENLSLMLGLERPAVVANDELRDRPRLEIAMYWGDAWNRFAATPESLALLPRVHQPQSGQYYPADRPLDAHPRGPPSAIILISAPLIMNST